MVGAIAAWLIGLKVSVMLILIFFDSGAMIGAVIGVITGMALVWLSKPRLLRHH